MTNVTVSPLGFLSTSGLGTVSIHINAAPVSGAVITLTSTFNSTTVTINHTGHGALEGDFVTFTSCELPSQFSSLVTLLVKEHEVVTVLNSDTYTITLSANAGFTLTASGLIEAEYQLNRGSTTQLLGSGWGAGTWGADGWGLASSEEISTTTGLRIYTQDNFGEDLILCPRGGELFFWRENDGVSTRAFKISDFSTSVPLRNRQVMVTSDRHVLSFGTTPVGSNALDRLLIRFSSQENAFDWTPTATNTAGDLRVEDGSTIVQAIKTRREIIVLTDTSVHSMQFIGPPFTFGINRISSNTTAISPMGAVAVEDAVFWMGKNRFYVYEGRVQPIPCTVRDHVFNDLNEDAFEKVVAGVNSEFGEVFWFYPSASSTENDKYVVYNYEQKIWYVGAFGRSAWIDKGIYEYPMASIATLVYNHEKTNDDDGTAMTSFIESSPIDIGDGENFTFVQRLIPDISFNNSETDAVNQAVFTIKGERFPGTGYVTSKTINVGDNATQNFVRVRGRAFGVRVESSNALMNWRLGSPRVEIVQDGKR
tara:strand:- start:361 stop:1971 length:1611 start_codon:yes stop_codon:yes gene_type:complete